MAPTIGIVGGTGFYSFLKDPEEVVVPTPYGPTSAPITVGEISGRSVAFIPRHGRDHEYLPHEIPYKSNFWALHQIGVRQILGINTVGSLQYEYRRGDLVLVDQLIDRTWGRPDTFFSGKGAAHLSLAMPYCERMRNLAKEALAGVPRTVHPEATVVVTQGPRFSTAAESRWFRSAGWQVLNMTQYPEVTLARELEVCYANLSYVSDYDVAAVEVIGEEGGEKVSHHAVVEAFQADLDVVVNAAERIVGALPEEADCTCRHALEGART